MQVPTIGIALAAFVLVAVTGPRLLERERPTDIAAQEATAAQAALATLRRRVTQLQHHLAQRVTPADAHELAQLREQLKRLGELSREAGWQLQGAAEAASTSTASETHARIDAR